MSRGDSRNGGGEAYRCQKDENGEPRGEFHRSDSNGKMVGNKLRLTARTHPQVHFIRHIDFDILVRSQPLSGKGIY